MGARHFERRVTIRILGLVASVMMGCLMWGLPASAQASSSPSEVQTEPAEVIPGGAKLQGKLNPDGLPTTYYFVYARDTCDEGCTPSRTTEGGPLTGDTEQEVEVEVTGLAAGRYWYYLVANNAEGTTYGALVNFTVEAAGEPSEVQTEPAEVIPGGAKLQGKLNPGGLPTTYYFEYIADNAIECVEVENCWPQTAGMGPITGDSQQEVTPTEVTGLRMGETYRYRLDASNAAGTAQSTVATFTVGFSPVITGLEPDRGPTSGGTTVTIHGEPLENARSVHFGTVEGKILHEECDKECEIMPYRTLVVESPPHAAGTVDVTVETAQGVSVASPGDKFTYGPSSGPSIESESVSNVTPTDATLEAQIDTEGLPTLYQFRLTSICGGKGACLVVINYPLPSGLLLGSFIDQSVSLDLNSAGVTLQPGGTYTYSLSVTSAAGTTEGPAQSLTTPEDSVQPLGTTTTPLAGADQSAAPSSGGQLAGSGGSTLFMNALGPKIRKATKPKALTNAQKLSKALKACEKKRKSRRAACEKQARKKLKPAV